MGIFGCRCYKITTTLHLRSYCRKLKAGRVINFLPLVPSSVHKMKFTDILSFILSVLGVNSLVLCMRFLLPRNVIPLASALLDETEAILGRAEADDGLPNANEFRTDIAILRNQVLQVRTQSHRSPWLCPQLRLAVLGLTWRVYTLHSEIAALRRGLEMAIDEHQQALLATVSSTQIATTAAQAAPAAFVAIPMVNIAGLPPPPPAAVVNPS